MRFRRPRTISLQEGANVADPALGFPLVVETSTDALALAHVPVYSEDR